MTSLKLMFSSPQWVEGRQTTQAEVELDHITAYRERERIVNVHARDLMLITAKDLPSTYLDAVRTVLPNAHRPWTAEEERALREMWAQGVPVGDMVAPLGRRYKAIKERARLLGLPARGRADRR